MSAFQQNPTQAAAANPSRSVWVGASAGTGKTSVLTNRVLRLLLQGVEPERILCITYTKAAAAEMQERIHKNLSIWVTLPAEALSAALQALTGNAPGEATLHRARRLFAMVLESPEGVRIQTIHAFCQSLLRRFPLEANLAPHFQLADDERTGQEILAEARQSLLDQLLQDDSSPQNPALCTALKRLIGDLREHSFGEAIKEITQKRDAFTQALAHYGGAEGLAQAVYRSLGVAPGHDLQQFLENACTLPALSESALRHAAATLGQSSGKKAQNAAGIMAEWLAAPPARRAELFDHYCSAFFTQNGAPKAESQYIAQKTRDEHPDVFDTLQAEILRLGTVRAHLRAVAVAEQTAALVQVAEALFEQMERIKASRGLVDYADLIQHTRKLLRQSNTAAWVLYKLDGGLDHLLVDEAQDTSPEQWEIVEALAEEFFAGEGRHAPNASPRTLFVVGDEKQSIFSFQGADPQAFEAMRRFFAERIHHSTGEPLEELSMLTSYRSVPAVLKVVDNLFEQPEARRGLGFSPAPKPISHLPNREGEAGRVELWPLVNPPQKEETQNWQLPTQIKTAHDTHAILANRIASTIRHWLDSGERLEAKNRPIQPGDIMILLRTRGKLAPRLLEALRRHHIPVAGADRLCVTSHLAVMDLCAMMQVLLLPEDDLSLASVLKSPLLGLAEEELYTLAAGREHQRLWQRLREMSDTSPTYQSAYTQLSTLRTCADTMPPFELLTHILDHMGGRRALESELGTEVQDVLDAFLDMSLTYEATHAPSIQGFLHWLAAAKDSELKRDMEQGHGQVRIMTVHASKGLQAPIVFLPDTIDNNPLKINLHWYPDEQQAGQPALPLWSTAMKRDCEATAIQREATRAARTEEANRLLYVALTRAEDRLYIGGTLTSKQKEAPEDSWYALAENTLKKLGTEQTITFAGEDEPVSIWRYDELQTKAHKATVQTKTAVKTPAPLPDWALQPAPAEPSPSRPLAPSRPSGETTVFTSPLTDVGDTMRQQAIRRGILIHRLLEILPEIPESEREARAIQWLARQSKDLTDAMQRTIWKQMQAVFDHPMGTILFGPGSQAEVPLTGLNAEGQAVSGQIDRLVITDDAILIADYKTNRSVPATPEQVPPEYIRQMAAYRSLISGIYPDHPIRTLLIWTETAQLMEVDTETPAILRARAS